MFFQWVHVYNLCNTFDYPGFVEQIALYII